MFHKISFLFLMLCIVSEVVLAKNRTAKQKDNTVEDTAEDTTKKISLIDEVKDVMNDGVVLHLINTIAGHLSEIFKNENSIAVMNSFFENLENITTNEVGSLVLGNIVESISFFLTDEKASLVVQEVSNAMKIEVEAKGGPELFITLWKFVADGLTHENIDRILTNIMESLNKFTKSHVRDIGRKYKNAEPLLRKSIVVAHQEYVNRVLIQNERAEEAAAKEIAKGEKNKK